MNIKAWHMASAAEEVRLAENKISSPKESKNTSLLWRAARFFVRKLLRLLVAFIIVYFFLFISKDLLTEGVLS